ncbi:folate-binding protein YgfZ [Ideonella sp. 4Y16]|uniref:CAF17-like 4Fe-4S cluster assembly/insertion protein YgfZ n=1 Tax=Ideonella alba TaxID=2824118 RepID=UPI001B393CDC|nr:folate-binding protein YgfZ [Ideonella alba]MBQ0942333.1 folate-binding protein YgfZ [Ideonella alba]
MNATPTSSAPANGVQRLDDWALIHASGDDAGSFLQGQLSNDVLGMQPGEARWAGYCTAKGRLIATFLVVRQPGGGYLLACSADLQAAVLKRLRMFVLRAKCQLSEPAWRVWGLLGAAGVQAAGVPLEPMRASATSNGLVVRLPDSQGQPRWLAGLSEEHPPLGEPLPAGLWSWLEVCSGVPRVTAATAEAFVPQMVNLELVGGVSFKKGCYPGQEVVARSQYRGTLKRRALLWHGEAPMAAGQEVFSAADPGQPAGMVVLAAPAPTGGWDALVETKLDAVSAPLHHGAPDGPALAARPLPYALPADAA